MDLDEKLDLIIARLDALDTRFDEMEAKFDMTDSRLEALDARFDMADSHLEALDSRLDVLDGMGGGFDTLESRLDVLDSMDGRFGEMAEQLECFNGLERDVRDLKMTLELETNKNIVRIAESHLDLSRRLDDTLKAGSETELLAVRVNVLENELRRIKEELLQRKEQ